MASNPCFDGVSALVLGRVDQLLTKPEETPVATTILVAKDMPDNTESGVLLQFGRLIWRYIILMKGRVVVLMLSGLWM